MVDIRFEKQGPEHGVEFQAMKRLNFSATTEGAKKAWDGMKDREVAILTGFYDDEVVFQVQDCSPAPVDPARAKCGRCGADGTLFYHGVLYCGDDCYSKSSPIQRYGPGGLRRGMQLC